MRVRLAVMLAMTLITVLLLGGFWWHVSAAERTSRDIRLAELATRQVLIVQRVGWNASRCMSGESQESCEAALAQVRLGASELVLLRSRLEAELASVQTPEAASLKELMGVVGGVENAAVSLGAWTPERGVEERDALARKLIRTAESVVARMQQAMSAMHARTAAGLSRTIERELTLTVLTLAMMVVIVVVVIEHAVRVLRRQHEALVESGAVSKRLAAVAERTTNAVVVTDVDRRICWVNNGFTRVTGYSLAEVMGKSPGSVLQCDKTDPLTIAQMRECLRTTGAFRGQILNRGKDGREYWLDIDIQPYTDDDGQTAGFIAIETDISEQVQSRNHLRAILSAIAEGIVELDRDGRIVDCNVAATRILELSRDQLIGTVVQKAAWGAEDENGRAMPGDTLPVAVTLRTGESFRNVVHAIRMEDGQTRWLSISTEPLRDERGRISGAVASFADVTAQRSQQRRMSLLVEGAGLGTWDWNVRTGEVEFNDLWSVMLGYSPRETVGRVETWRELLHPEDRDRVLGQLEEHLEGRTNNFRCEQRLRRKDGTWGWVISSGRVIERDPEGRALRATGVHMDISAQKALEGSLAEAKARAEVANASKSEFLANMSHEIRTPITAILGFADLLATEGDVQKAPPARLEMIDTIRRNGHHLLAVINDILDLSKIEAGKMQIECVETSPVAIAHEVRSLMDVKARGKGLKLGVCFDGPLPARVRTDPVRLRQILVNLVGNAIKFTEKGEVTLRLAWDSSQGRLACEVIDTGIGMTPEQMSRLFGAFAQADASTARRFGGTGLGLRISQRFAEMLGGRIGVRSSLGEGSTFSLILPCDASAGRVLITPEDARKLGTDRSATAPAPTAGRLAGLRVLLMEDGPDNQRLIAYHLRKAGATVTTAENGRLGVEAMSVSGCGSDLRVPSPFDLIVTDVQMPEMDGFTAVRLLRGKGCALPIVALTAHAMRGDREACLAAGCDEYATKPIDAPALLDACARALRSRLSEGGGEQRAAA